MNANELRITTTILAHPELAGQYRQARRCVKKNQQQKNDSSLLSVFALAAAGIECESGNYENPIQRPPMPTPDHSSTETTATTLL